MMSYERLNYLTVVFFLLFNFISLFIIQFHSPYLTCLFLYAVFFISSAMKNLSGCSCVWRNTREVSTTRAHGGKLLWKSEYM